MSTMNKEQFYGAKMVARQMDLLLKKSGRKAGDDLEDKMDEAMTVFKFIKDKDTFLKVRLYLIEFLVGTKTCLVISIY